MSHIESFSLNPEKDKALIEWLRQPGSSKSDKVKKALYLYMKFGQLLDLPELAERLVELPNITERLARIENRLAGGQIIASEDEPPPDKKAGLDMMAQMDGF